MFLQHNENQAEYTITRTPDFYNFTYNIHTTTITTRTNKSN